MSEAKPNPENATQTGNGSATGSAEEAVEVVVQGDASALAQRIQAGPHCFAADEPLQLGGEDTGPSPYQLLLGALGSCTAITITMYARRKEWPLEGVTVRLRHSRRNPREAEQAGAADHIEREIVLSGPLTEAQRARLFVIAERCPVHRTLLSPVEITTSEG